MSGWKELLLDVLKLTDEVKRLNRDKTDRGQCKNFCESLCQWTYETHWILPEGRAELPEA